MFVITANVRYCSNGPLVPSFLNFSLSPKGFIWDDESAEFFNNYRSACALVDDYNNNKISWALCYYDVEDVKVKEIKIFDIS